MGKLKEKAGILLKCIPEKRDTTEVISLGSYAHNWCVNL